jgi:hypothetical protein
MLTAMYNPINGRKPIGTATFTDPVTLEERKVRVIERWPEGKKMMYNLLQCRGDGSFQWEGAGVPDYLVSDVVIDS